MRHDPFAQDDVRVSSQVAGLRYFTDRENFTEAFHNRVNAPAGQPGRVLVFFGVGGIGKSTLARKFCADLQSLAPPVPHAIVDIETLRDKTRADRETLVRFRAHLEKEFRVGFPRFDLCLAVLTAREGGDPEPLTRISPLLRGVFDFVVSLPGVPLPGAGLVEQLVHKFKLEGWVRQVGGTQEVLRLRRCDDRELAAELIKRFAEDLRSNLPAREDKTCRGVLLLDTYEALWAGREAAASVHGRLADEWVRSLAEYCLASGVLLVIHGRDRLPWSEADPDWQAPLEQHLLGGLSSSDAQAFLARCGVGPEAEREATVLQDAIIRCCNLEAREDAELSCHPLYLALCAEIVLNTKRAEGAEPTSDFFRGIPSKQIAVNLADRFLRSLHNGAMEGWVEELSVTPRFDEEVALALDEGRRHQNGRKGWEELTHFSFVEQEASGFYHLHKTMRDVLRARVEEGKKRDVHAWFAAHWGARDRPALAWFHRWSMDPEERLNEWERLHDSALKNQKMAGARSLLGWWSDVALDEADRAAMQDELWGRTHMALGRALLNTPVVHLSVALTASIQHSAAALRVRTEADFPFDWAMTQNNLGRAYANLPTKDQAANLEKAIACYQATLRVFTEAAYPRNWAMIQNNLGIAYSDLPTGDRAANLARAVTCYEAALRVITETDFPCEWATAQDNLGTAYSDLPTGDRAANLAKAVAYYEAALRVRTKADYPRDWASTQNNLGIAYFDLPTGDRAANMARAVACYEAALRVRTEADFPGDWAMTQNNLGTAYFDLPTGDRAANLGKAIACYEAALRVRTEADFPGEWAATQHNLGTAYLDLPKGDRAANMARAVACYEATLRVHTEADFPRLWAMTQNNLGLAYFNLPAGDRATNLAKAVACHEAALRVRTETGCPRDWARTQLNLGLALKALSALRDAPELLHRARESFEAARRGFEATGLSAKAQEAAEAAVAARGANCQS